MLAIAPRTDSGRERAVKAVTASTATWATTGCATPAAGLGSSGGTSDRRLVSASGLGSGSRSREASGRGAVACLGRGRGCAVKLAGLGRLLLLTSTEVRGNVSGAATCSSARVERDTSWVVSTRRL